MKGLSEFRGGGCARYFSWGNTCKLKAILVPKQVALSGGAHRNALALRLKRDGGVRILWLEQGDTYHVHRIYYGGWFCATEWEHGTRVGTPFLLSMCLILALMVG